MSVIRRTIYLQLRSWLRCWNNNYIASVCVCVRASVSSPEFNRLARVSESAGTQLEGKPVAEQVLWATKPQSVKQS